MNNIREEVRKMKLVSPAMASTSNEDRGRMLRGIAEALTVSKDRIFAANAEDVAAAETEGISPSIIKRLRFTEEKLRDCLSGIDTMIRLPDPTGKIELARELDEGLTLYRVTVPIGVIGVIFEARPDALVQISCLCIRSGNCAVLKGGRETAKTNKVLFDIIKAAAVQEGMPADALLQGDGDPPVVHHQHLPVVFPGQALGHLAGAAEPRRHGEVEDGVVGLQQGIPQGGDLKGSGLGGGDPGPLAHPVKKHGVGQVAALKVELPVDGKGHGDEMDPDLRRGCRGEPAVGVGHNGCFQGAHLPALIG